MRQNIGRFFCKYIRVKEKPFGLAFPGASGSPIAVLNHNKPAAYPDSGRYV